MIPLDAFIMTQPNQNDFLEKKEPESKVNTVNKCRDFACGMIFILYMLANLILCGVSIFNGHFQNISKVVDYNNITCGNGTNQDYPYLYYPMPCSGKLNIKICVKECPSSVDAAYNSLNSSSTQYCLQADQTYDTDLTCSTNCSVYNTYPYIQKICVPTGSSNSIITLIQNHDTEIMLSNIAVSYKQILYLSATAIGVAFVAYFLQVLLPKAIYLFVAIIFISILLLAFLILKLTQIRKLSLPSDLSNSPLILNDQNRQQIISYILFSIYFFCLPLLMLIKQRLKKAVLIMKFMTYYLFTSPKIHMFNLICVLTLCIQFSFQMLSLINYFTSGKTIPSDSPFVTYDHKIVHPTSLAFLSIGFIWLVSFTLSYHKFIICSYTHFWFRQEQQNGPTFEPLKRSIAKSYYNFGSISLDAILWPFNLLVTFIYSISRNQFENIQQQQQSNRCVLCCNDMKFKIRKAIQIAYKFLNRGSFCQMVINNQNYFTSNKQSVQIHLDNYNRHFGFGTILFIYNVLFTIIVSLLISYLVLYFKVINIQLPPAMSSLVVPLLIVFLFSLLVGVIMGNTTGYSLDTMIMCTIVGTMKPEPQRYAFEVSKIIEDV